VAGGAQTFGKCFALAILFMSRPQASSSDRLRLGLLTGLGFTVYEIALIFFSMASAQQTVVGYGGLCERASASVFHIYSGGLLALAFASGRCWPLVLVFVVHGWSDFLAGAGVSLGFSVSALEWAFGMWAVILWAVFLFADRSASVGSEINRTARCITTPGT